MGIAELDSPSCIQLAVGSTAGGLSTLAAVLRDDRDDIEMVRRRREREGERQRDLWL